MKTTDLSEKRDNMVSSQIATRGVRDRLVLAAMRSVPRERFVPASLRECAYDDTPLPIVENQTISQPYIVAFMVDSLALIGGEKVLEIGTGSGYAAVVIAAIADEVYTVERIGALARLAAETLESLGCVNVHVRHGDGTPGLAGTRALRCDCRLSGWTESSGITEGSAQNRRADGHAGRHCGAQSGVGLRHKNVGIGVRHRADCRGPLRTVDW
jgi:hypothetical protein